MDRQFQHLTQIIAGIVIFLAGMTIIAWYSHISWLLQVSSRFFPMQFNTAICCIFSALALWLHIKPIRYSRYSRVCSFIALVLASLTFLQYVFQIDF